MAGDRIKILCGVSTIDTPFVRMGRAGTGFSSQRFLMSGANSEFGKLLEQMRVDWDRRIAHDYRFWMSDGYADDRAMWESGARDFTIVTRGYQPSPGKTILDLGCGVGRLLRPAAKAFGQVIGVDVSAEAIAKAREFLCVGPEPLSNVQLVVGNGSDLQPVPDASVDLVVSFAAISSIPTEVVGNYFREIHRVLKPDGEARLQLYVGSEQPVRREDTLHLRCYQRSHLGEALRLAGLTLTNEEELVLPIQVSFKEIGIEAVIVSIRRSDAEPRSADEIARALLPGGEPPDAQSTLGNDLEYWMSLNYARELAERGDLDRARETLEYAERVSHTTAVDVRDLLERITDKLKNSPVAQALNAPAPQSGTNNSEGWNQLIARFPNLGAQYPNEQKPASIEIRSTEEGPAMFLDGIPLDHVHKPRSSAHAWAKQIVADPRYRDCDEVVLVGLGSGYHVEALRAHGCKKPIHVLEDSLAVVKAAAESRPDTWVHTITSLSVGANAKVPDGERKIEIFTRAQSQAAAPEFCSRIRSDFYGSRGLSLLKPQIGVLGPLSGGTLPMVPYLCRGLYGVGQRFREYDVSGFSGGYDQVSKFIRDKSRRTGVENTYCEMVSQVLLESVNERPIDILICLALAPISPRVLMELRKRGVITVLWFVEDYTRFTYWKEMAQYYDFVFTIQRGQCLEAIRGAGAGEVHYLPVACDPGIHTPMALSAEERQRWGSPISFMGAGYHNRQQLFASLAEYPLKIWGTEWPGCRPFDRMVQEGGRRLTPAEYVKVFNASDININLHSSHERDGVDPFGDFLNPRTFELAASGVFQLVDQRSLLPEAFDVGSEIVTFSSVRELKEQIEYYLAHPEARGRIAQAGRARALKDHTYTARLKQMLSIVFSSRYEQLKNRLDQSPWQKVLSRAKQYPELYERCERAFQRGEEPNLDGLVSDVVTGQGKLSETEQKLMFLFHVRKQIIRMREEETSGKT